MIDNVKSIGNKLLLRLICFQGTGEVFDTRWVFNAGEDLGRKQWHKRRLRRLQSTNYIGRAVDRVVHLFQGLPNVS
jgi:hypothetical protein